MANSTNQISGRLQREINKAVAAQPVATSVQVFGSNPDAAKRAALAVGGTPTQFKTGGETRPQLQNHASPKFQEQASFNNSFSNLAKGEQFLGQALIGAAKPAAPPPAPMA